MIPLHYGECGRFPMAIFFLTQVIKYVPKWMSCGSKHYTNELKLECAYFLGQTS